MYKKPLLMGGRWVSQGVFLYAIIGVVFKYGKQATFLHRIIADSKSKM